MSKRLYDGHLLSPVEKLASSLLCLTLKRAYSLPASDHCAVISLIMEENKLVKPPTVMKHQDHTDFMNNRFLLMCFKKIWLLPFLYYFIWQTGKR